MPEFKYQARRSSGETVAGALDVADRAAAVSQITRLGLVPVSVVASAAATKAGATGGAGAILQRFGKRKRSRRRPSLRELATFTLQLANLLKAGMPLTQALRSLTTLTTRGFPPEVCSQLRQDVTEGRSLGDAMARQTDIFPPIVINMVRAGEQSGSLEEVLRRQAEHFERFAEVQARFRSAMVYPLVVCSVGVALVTFFMTVMLPKFSVLFESIQGLELPASTRFLIGSSQFIARWWWFILLVLGVVVFLFRRYRVSPSGRKLLDRLSLRLPIFGRVIQLNLFGQFASTLGALLRNGVPVLQALRITEQIISNSIVAGAIATAREAVTDGKALADPLRRSGLFPQLMIDLLKIGEETGDIPGSLENVADTYERELTLALRNLTNLIEPVMIVGIAIVVGFLLMSVMSAMFAITQSIQRS